VVNTLYVVVWAGVGGDSRLVKIPEREIGETILGGERAVRRVKKMVLDGKREREECREVWIREGRCGPCWVWWWRRRVRDWWWRVRG
jgi:hypothetical protein